MLNIIFSVGLALALTLSIYFALYLLRHYRYWENKGVPVEENFFFVKDIYKVFSGKVSFGQFLADLYTHHDREPYFRFYMLGRPYLFVRDPLLIKAITTRDFGYFENRSFACEEATDPVVAKSVFLARNPHWKSTRTKLNALFSPIRIKSTIPNIIKTSKRMEEYLERRDKDIVDFKEVAENLITNLGPLIFLGINSHCSFDKEDNTIKDSIKNIFGKGIKQGFAFFSYMFIPRLVKLFQLSIGNYEFLKSAIDDMVSYKENDANKGKEIPDLLVNHKDQANDKNANYFDGDWLVSQALTFIIAGFLPPVSLFAFALYELSQHQECQEKLRKEILQNFTSAEEISYEKVAKMKYLNMVISETLRRNPLGGFVNRVCTKSYVIEDSGLTIERGTPLLISVDALHSDPNYYPEPKRFDPERFRDGTKDLENAGVFIPFGTGQRRCIGEKFTNVSIKMALVHLIRKFRFEPCHLTEKVVQLDPKSISTTPLNGIKLRVHKL